MPHCKTRRRSVIAAVLCAIMTAGPAAAQIEDAAGRLVVELNAVQSTEAGCTFSFLVINGLPEAIDSLVLETVLFDSEGRVDRLTLFDFESLPAARPRVRQFAVPGPSCDGFGAVLINGVQTCETGGTTSSACDDALDLNSRVGIDLLG